MGSPAAPGSVRLGRVLVVEDHPVNQLVMTRVVEKLGFTVDVAANGAEAVRAARAVDYDAVLMDIQMPELDGYGATERIRSAELERGSRRVPIIAVTASAVPGERERCLAAGMDACLTKPVRPEEVAAALRRWAATPSFVDPDQLAALRDIYESTAELRDAVATFAEELRRTVERIDAAAGAGDVATVKRMAHSLVGSAGTLGATALAVAAREVEAAVGADGLDGLLDLASLSELCERSIDALMAATAP